VDKNSNLENGVRVQMDKFNLVTIKESAEEVTGGRPNLLWKEVKDRRRRPEGREQEPIKIPCRELSLYPKIDPTPLSSNSAKTA
jgi:hypothetical protein